MSDQQEFSGFSIRIRPDGAAVAAFRLADPPWAEDPAEAPRESLFDAASLSARIRNLRRVGAHCAVSEAAFQALAGLSQARRREDAVAEAPAPAIPPEVLIAALEAGGQPIALISGGAAPSVLHATRAFRRRCGLDAEAGPGALDPALLIEGGLPVVDAALRGARLPGVRLRLPVPAEGRLLPLHLQARPGAGYLALLLDPPAGAGMQAGAAAAAVAERALDPLTGLPGPAALVQALAAEVARAGRTAATPARPAAGPCLARLRLVGAEALRATHGPAVLDALLLGVADRMTECLRRIDAIARLEDGAEFAVVLPRVGLTEARAVAARLIAALTAAPIATPAGPIAPRFGIGLAECGPGLSAVAMSLEDRLEALLAAARADMGDRAAGLALSLAPGAAAPG